MKAEFTSDGFLKISPENTAEKIALKYMFINEQDSIEWVSRIVIQSDIPEDKSIMRKED